MSIELTTQMLATLFDFPWEERRKLTRWSDVATALPEARHDRIASNRRRAELEECGDVLHEALERARQPSRRRRPDLDDGAQRSHAEHGSRDKFLGNLILLIVGGNDTTRNSHVRRVYALNKFPDQYQKLRDNPALVESMVPEIIRWQTPLAHMRRTALADIEIGGKTIKKGDKVVMWYVSGNRDEEVIDKPDDFIIDRKPAAHAPVVRLRHPPLRRHPAGRAAAEDRLGRDPQALRQHRGGGRAEAGLFQLREGLRAPAGAHRGVSRRIPNRQDRPSNPCFFAVARPLRPGYCFAKQGWSAMNVAVSAEAAAVHDNHQDIRDAVAKLCEGFPGEYWRKLDREMAYPTEFVQALTESGYLGVLIPEEYGGAGLKISAGAAILEEVHRAGCNAGACHAQMYTMGTVLRHGSEEQKEQWLPRIATGELRLQAFGVTEPTSGTDTSSLRTTAKRDGDHYIVNGQKIWTSRAEHSDLMLLLARTTPKDQADEAHRRPVGVPRRHEGGAGNGLTIRPIRTMMNHSTTEVFFDNMKVPAENLIGEEGKGFRYILSGMNAERILIASECDRRRQMVHQEGDRLRQASAWCSAGRSARTRASSSRSPRPMRRCAPPS